MEEFQENNGGFLRGYIQEKDAIYEELKSRVDMTVLRVMKNYLRENNIQFDDSIMDLQEFKNTVIGKLQKTQQVLLVKLEKDMHRELTEMTQALHDGSQTAFTAVVEKLGDFGKMALRMTARMSAMQVAYALNPSLGGAALATSIALPAVIKGVRSYKDKEEESKSIAVDGILLELCVVTDNDSKKRKFEVPKSIMQMIKDNLKTYGIDIDTTSTLGFIRDISGLDIEKKEIAVKAINNFKGNPIDYDSKIKGLKSRVNNLRTILKEDVVAPLSTATMVGLNVGNSLATWDPEISASVITALGTGLVTGDLTAATVAGGAQLALGKSAQMLPPAIGDIIQNVNELETMAGSTGIVLTGALLLKVVPTLAKHGFLAARNFIRTKVKDNKNRKLLNEQEKIELGEKIETTLDLTAKTIEGKSAREVSLGIIADTLRARGIHIDDNILSREDLKKHIQLLNREDKKDVAAVADVLKNVQDLKGNQLKQTLSSLAKYAYWGGVIALAGLGTYDAFLNPGFIEGLTARQAYGLDMEVGPEEKLKSVGKIIQDIPEKLGNLPETLGEAIENPEGFIEEKLTLQKNAEQMTAEQEALMNSIGTTIPEGLNTVEELWDWQQQQVERIIAERQAAAEKAYQDAVSEFVELLPAEASEKVLISEVSVPWLGLPNIDINVTTNDLVIRTLELNTTEGLIKLFEETGMELNVIKKLMEAEKVSTLEGLAQSPNVQRAIEELGDYNYFPDEELSFWEEAKNFWGSIFTGKVDYKDEMVEIINHRADRIMKFIPTKDATPQEVTEFLGWICDKQGNVDAEKLKYYTLLQQKRGMADNSAIGEFIRKISSNMEIDPTSDDLFEQVGTAIKVALDEQAKQNQNQIVELFQKHRESIIKQEAAMEIVKETEVGFVDGINSNIPTNPVELSGNAATIGVATGLVVKTNKGILEKIKGLFKKVFGKEQSDVLLPGCNEKLPEKSDRKIIVSQVDVMYGDTGENSEVTTREKEGR